jgi:hypothetical protein
LGRIIHRQRYDTSSTAQIVEVVSETAGSYCAFIS